MNGAGTTLARLTELTPSYRPVDNHVILSWYESLKTEHCGVVTARVCLSQCYTEAVYPFTHCTCNRNFRHIPPQCAMCVSKPSSTRLQPPTPRPTVATTKATANESTTNGRRLAKMTNDELRTTNDELRTTNYERRTTNDERRTTDDGRRTTNDERRTTNDERRTTTNERRTERSNVVVVVFVAVTSIVIFAYCAVGYYTHNRIVERCVGNCTTDEQYNERGNQRRQ